MAPDTYPPGHTKFVVFGTPVAQPRPRACVVRPYPGGRASARVYNADGNITVWKQLVARAAREAFAGDQPSGDAFAVVIAFHFLRPKRGKTIPIDGVPKTTKPDLDNLAKPILDVLTRLRVWADDSQVVALTCTKHYHEYLSGASVLVVPLQDRHLNDAISLSADWWNTWTKN